MCCHTVARSYCSVSSLKPCTFTDVDPLSQGQMLMFPRGKGGASYTGVRQMRHVVQAKACKFVYADPSRYASCMQALAVEHRPFSFYTPVDKTDSCRDVVFHTCKQKCCSLLIKDQSGGQGTVPVNKSPLTQFPSKQLQVRCGSSAPRCSGHCQQTLQGRFCQRHADCRVPTAGSSAGGYV